MLPWNPEPRPATLRRFPYIVVHLMPTVYQREEIALRIGPPEARIGHRNSFIQHPSPYARNGAIGPECRQLLVAATLEAVQRTRFRMCVVWAPDDCTFVERDGSTKESDDPPSGGFGTGGVGGQPLPSDIQFDRRSSN